MKKIIITIDGPAGSGKSATAKEIAKRLNIAFLNTGAMYRALTYAVLTEKAESEDEIIALAKKIEITFKHIDGEDRVYLNNQDVTKAIITSEVEKNVSRISSIPEVRKILVAMQQKFGENNSLVAEGRDTGTVVFPNADFKFFMKATEEERAKRRFKELQSKGYEPEFEDILKSIKERDKIDSEREISPLKKADDAIEIDTTFLSFEDQVEKILNLINESLQKVE
jgi:cytidylate kinase